MGEQMGKGVTRLNRLIPKPMPQGNKNPDPKLKGVKGGNCNRTACQRPGAIHVHKHIGAYYCEWCADDIQEFASRVDKMECFPSMIERYPIQQPDPEVKP